MSRVLSVLRNKNRVEKLMKEMQRDELAEIKSEGTFKMQLLKEIGKLELLLNDEDVDEIILEVPDNSIVKFSSAIYSDELSNYNIRQVEGQYNKFIVSRKMLDY